MKLVGDSGLLPVERGASQARGGAPLLTTVLRLCGTEEGRSSKQNHGAVSGRKNRSGGEKTAFVVCSNTGNIVINECFG